MDPLVAFLVAKQFCWKGRTTRIESAVGTRGPLLSHSSQITACAQRASLPGSHTHLAGFDYDGDFE